MIESEQKYVQLEDHPLRYELANELHARPFPTLTAPSHVVFLAIKRPVYAASRDRDTDMAHLEELLDRHGAMHPSAEATHYFGVVGRHRLKWENHNEFVTYTFFCEGLMPRPFDPSVFDVFPDDWIAKVPGHRFTSALIHVDHMPEKQVIKNQLRDWFVAESLAVSEIFDRSALMASDFRIDEGGHIRFAVFVDSDVGERRVGRIVQRLCEVETYKSMSMLGFASTRHLMSHLAKIDSNLCQFVSS